MRLLYDELLTMAKSEEVSVRESEGIIELSEIARIEEAYNRIYAQSLPLARADDEATLNLFFEAIA
jgi:hypothetical protein